MQHPASSTKHPTPTACNRDGAIVEALLLVPEPVEGQQKRLAKARPVAIAEGIAQIKYKKTPTFVGV